MNFGFGFDCKGHELGWVVLYFELILIKTPIKALSHTYLITSSRNGTIIIPPIFLHFASFWSFAYLFFRIRRSMKNVYSVRIYKKAIWNRESKLLSRWNWRKNKAWQDVWTSMSLCYRHLMLCIYIITKLLHLDPESTTCSWFRSSSSLEP